MPLESQNPVPSQAPHQLAGRLAAFYGAVFGLIGTHLPFFPVWLAAIGLEPGWIGVIVAVPSLTRFTVLPFVTHGVERYAALHRALIAIAFLTALGFFVLGVARLPLLVLAIYIATACVWTPMVPLADAYALKAVQRYRLDFGPVRLWGSAAFVAGALACGALVEWIAPVHLIWVIAGTALLGALVSLGLRPLDPVGTKSGDAPRPAIRAGALLRHRGFLAVIAAAALIQGSHAAYYTFASIAWRGEGFGGLTIAGLWALGVIAEIVLFAWSPRLPWSPAALIVIGAAAGVLRWSVTALEPPLASLALVQLLHGLTFGATLLGTMGLLSRLVPGQIMASAQGLLVAATGGVSSAAAVLTGLVYAQWGASVYFLMAVMAGLGGVLLLAANDKLGVPVDAAP